MAIRHRPTSFPEMAALLAERGLPPIVLDMCRATAMLVDDPDGRSRIGGLPRLAPGTPWPTGPDGPHAHVASIRLDDLPAGIGPEGFDGELAIFMGPSEWWDGPPAPGFAVIHTPAAELGDPVASPPREVGVNGHKATGERPARLQWHEQRLSVRETVSLPWQSGCSFPMALEQYLDDDAYDALYALDQEMRIWDPDATIEGHAVLGDAAKLPWRESLGEQPVVIQLNSMKSYFEAPELEFGSEGWIFNDVWTLLLCCDPAAFRDGRFDQLVAEYTTGHYARGPRD